MKLLTFSLCGLLAMSLLVPPASAGSAVRLLAPKAGAGGGAVSGGAYSAFTTIAADATAVPARGGDYEITGGLERRRDTGAPEPPIFRDGFEGS
jgi:hypothetical protein